MAVAGSNLIANSNTTPAASYNTASISPGSSRLQLAVIFGVDDLVTTDPTFTLSGNGLTWVSVLRVGGGGAALQVFRAMGASPTAGAVTISSDVTTLLFAQWVFSEFTGINTGGTNGSAAIGNTASNTAGAASSLTVTLPAFGSANNGTFGAFMANDFNSGSAFNFTPGTGFTELAENVVSVVGGAIANGLQAEWRATNDTSVDATATRAMTGWSGIALEIVAAAAGLVVNPLSGRGGAATQPLVTN